MLGRRRRARAPWTPLPLVSCGVRTRAPRPGPIFRLARRRRLLSVPPVAPSGFVKREYQVPCLICRAGERRRLHRGRVDCRCRRRTCARCDHRIDRLYRDELCWIAYHGGCGCDDTSAGTRVRAHPRDASPHSASSARRYPRPLSRSTADTPSELVPGPSPGTRRRVPLSIANSLVDAGPLPFGLTTRDLRTTMVHRGFWSTPPPLRGDCTTRRLTASRPCAPVPRGSSTRCRRCTPVRPGPTGSPVDRH